MFRLTRSALALKGAKSSRNLRGVATHSFKQHEITRSDNVDEDARTDENLDDFTKEFLSNKIKMTDFQRMLLTAGSSIAALLDPRRQDMIACLGETTGEEAMHRILHAMETSVEGREILREKPRINTKTVNLEELKNMSPDSFGFHYFKFLEDNVSLQNFFLSFMNKTFCRFSK